MDSKFPELKTTLFRQVETCIRAAISLPPCSVIVKAQKIAEQLELHSFTGIWGWYRRSRLRYGLGSMLLYWEGTEVDKDDPVLLQQLNALYDLIKQYDSQNIYNMDETGMFFRTLPRYSVLLPDEDMSTTRGRRK